MSKRTIIKGTLILTITGILTKCLGFYNRIFLTRLIGVKELGTYQLIFPLYILGISFCCQGIATTITKHVSYLLGKKKYSDTRRALCFGGFLSFVLSLLVSACFFFGCDFIAMHILKNTDCRILLRILSPAVPFVAIKACINAFFIGHEKPVFSGSCQLIEQIIRIGSVYLLAISYMQDHVDAKTAVLGVVIGEMGATFYAVSCYILFRRKQNQANRLLDKDMCISVKKKSSLMIPMLKDIIPITSNNLIFTLFSSFEAIILPTFLFQYYNNADHRYRDPISAFSGNDHELAFHDAASVHFLRLRQTRYRGNKKSTCIKCSFLHHAWQLRLHPVYSLRKANLYLCL